MNFCSRIGKLFTGCKFEGRYSEALPDGFVLGDVKGAAGGISILVDAHKSKTYIHDICIRCGKIVKRETK
jgi:hypothetical protein